MGVLRISLGMSSAKISKFGSKLDPTSRGPAGARVELAGGRVLAGARVGAAGGRVGACFRVDFSVSILNWILLKLFAVGLLYKHSRE